jgi:hypothetical protein
VVSGRMNCGGFTVQWRPQGGLSLLPMSTRESFSRRLLL